MEIFLFRTSDFWFGFTMYSYIRNWISMAIPLCKCEYRKILRRYKREPNHCLKACILTTI